MARSLGCRLRFAAFFCVLAGTTFLSCEGKRSLSPEAPDPFSADTLAPARVSDLTVAEIGSTWVNLIWKQPGDDGFVGHAVAYDLRYAVADTFAWESMNRSPDLPKPGNPGSFARHAIRGLHSGTKYRFVVRTADDVGNWSQSSNALFVRTKGPQVPVDAVPPARVTDLRVIDFEPRTLELRWTAPGDDGHHGRATAYDVRYTDADSVVWDEMVSATNPPIPSYPGNANRLEIRGLFPSTQYHFALKTMDKAHNWSEESNRVVGCTLGHEAMAPSPIRDLIVTGTGLDQVRIEWTAPGADGDIGTATAYDIRIAEHFGSDYESWESAQRIPNPPAPLPAGSQQSFAFSGVAPNARMMVRMKAVDEEDNWSEISNIGAFHTRVPEDAHWWDGFGTSPDGQGLNGTVFSLLVHDGLLIAGGRFTRAGRVEAHKVAAWDGQGWHALGAGLSDEVRVLGQYEGDIVAGGVFPGGIARWTGATWELVGGGVDDRVFDFVEYEGDLVVCGRFDRAGAVRAPDIARWDGERWHWMGETDWEEGFSVSEYSALAIFEGRLIAACWGSIEVGEHYFTLNAVEWDGERWEPILVCDYVGYTGSYPTIESLHVLDEALYLAGRDGVCFHPEHGFSTLGRYQDGHWTSFGMATECSELSCGGVIDVTLWNGYLVAGGGFALRHHSGSSSIAYNNGSAWYPLGSGFRHPSWDWMMGDTRYSGCYAVAVYQGELYAGGSFSQAGGTTSKFMAKWVE